MGKDEFQYEDDTIHMFSIDEIVHNYSLVMKSKVLVSLPISII